MKEKKSNLQKLKAISSNEIAPWHKQSRWREENKSSRDYCKKIALLVLRAMRQKEKTQVDIAKVLNVSPQYVSNLLRGKETNLGMETVCKLQDALGITLLIVADEAPTVLVIKSNDNSEFIAAVEGQKSEETYTDSLRRTKKFSQIFVNAEDSEEIANLVMSGEQ